MSQQLTSGDGKVASITSNPTSGKSTADIFDALSVGDDQETLDLTTPLKKGKDKDEKEETTDEDIDETDEENDEEEDEEDEDPLKELEEDLEEIDDEKLELTTPVKRREILKKYPNLFKDFPYLEKAYFREQQFTEILSTIDDAKEAAESHRVLGRFTEDMVEKGNINNVLKMIKDSNPETFNRVVDNWMDFVEQVDPTAALHIQGNIVKNIILGMVEEAKSSGDEDYKTAALLLNKWAFGTSKFSHPTKMSKDTKPEDKTKESELTEREKAFAQRQIDTAMSEVNTRVNNIIKSAIDNNIDPKGSMTEYVKRNASRDALEKITNLIERDTRFQTIVDKLWEKSAKANFSKESQDEIRRAFLSKAKSLLAPVLKSARNEALKGMGKRVREDKDDEEQETEPQRLKSKKPNVSRNTEQRLSSDKQKAKLDSVRGKSSFEALNALMGDA
jgi:hypothetical protein